MEASQTLLISYLSKYDVGSADSVFPNIVTYTQMLGADRGSHFLLELRNHAPEWYEPVAKHFRPA